MKFNYKKIILEFISISIIFPIIILFIWSFIANWRYPDLIPKQFSNRGFQFLFDVKNLEVLFNSILISLAVVIITLIISVPAAKAIALYDFKGKKIFEMLILTPIIIPMISVAMGINIYFIKWGLSGTYLGVIIINIVPCLPYSIRLIEEIYEMMGDKYEVEASALGADNFQIFKYITFPLILPGIIAAGAMSFIISFGQYFLTMLIGAGKIITYPMVMFPYIQSGDRTIASVYSVVFLIISILIFFIIEKSVKKIYKNN